VNEFIPFIQTYWPLVLPLFIVQSILMLVALIDCWRIEQTSGPKWAWVIIIVVVNIFGPIAYFVAGRKG
jgi:hypothetical protein